MARVLNLAKNFTALGEGPHWDETKQRLLFVDIDNATIHRWDHATENFAAPIVLKDPSVGAVVTRENGGLIAAASHRFASIDENTGEVQTLKEVTSNVHSRFNDGKCDPRGRFWAGTMGLEREPAVPVPQQAPIWIFSTTKNPNSAKFNVQCFKYDPATGDISDPQVVVEFQREEHGIPDGHCIDADGNIWLAMYGLGAILKVDTTKGEIVSKIKISDSALRTTSCCFGGPNFDEMFVTSARYKQPDFDKGVQLGDSGSLFKVTGLGVRGLPAMPFKG